LRFWAGGRISPSPCIAGEHINSVFILIAALCTYVIGYRFYSKWIAAKVLMLNDRRATPCEVNDDGKDFVKTNKWIVFGHHFAAISGPGPLVGPVLAAQFGYLPGTLWILDRRGAGRGGAGLGDFIRLDAAERKIARADGEGGVEHDGRLDRDGGDPGDHDHPARGAGVVVVKALAESPWGVFTVAATIPIAMFMGGYMRFWRIGKVMEASAIGVVLLLLAVWGGKLVYANAYVVEDFSAERHQSLAWAIIIYGLAASVLPVWLLLAPRDYLSTFMKLGTIFALAVGIFLVLPDLQMPADHQVRGRLGFGRGGEVVSVLLHHDCVRGDFWVSHTDRQRHDAEDHHPGELRAAHRLRGDVSGIVGGHHGHRRGLHDGPGRVSRHERERRSRRNRCQSHGAGLPGDGGTHG
jgi:hypothetical protein